MSLLVRTLSLLFVIFYVQPGLAKVKLSQLINICDAKDPKLNDCVMASATKLVRQIKMGVRDLGIAGLDPMNVPLMEIGQDSGSVNMKLELIDTIHTGLSDSIFEYADIDVENMIWKIGFRVPHYNILGKYKADGKVLLLPITGSGRINFTLVDPYTVATLYGKKKQVDGKEYFDLHKVEYKITLKPGNSFLNGDPTEGPKRLAQAMRAFLMDNADVIMDSVKGTLEALYSEIALEMLRRVFLKVPYNEILHNV